jgi:hypothetical protein
MHGAQQRFAVKVLKRKLRAELELCRKSIFDDKGRVMDGNKYVLQYNAISYSQQCTVQFGVVLQLSELAAVQCVFTV